MHKYIPTDSNFRGNVSFEETFICSMSTTCHILKSKFLVAHTSSHQGALRSSSIIIILNILSIPFLFVKRRLMSKCYLFHTRIFLDLMSNGDCSRNKICSNLLTYSYPEQQQSALPKTVKGRHNDYGRCKSKSQFLTID